MAQVASMPAPVAGRRPSRRLAKADATDWAAKRQAKIQAAKEKREQGHFDKLDKVTEHHTFEPKRIAKAFSKASGRRRSSLETEATTESILSSGREYRDNTTRSQAGTPGTASVIRRRSSDRDSASGASSAPSAHEKGIRTPRMASERGSESPAPSAVFVPGQAAAQPRDVSSTGPCLEETILFGSASEVDVTFADASNAASFVGAGTAAAARASASSSPRDWQSRPSDVDTYPGVTGNARDVGASYSTTAESSVGAVLCSSGPSLASTYANGERDEPMASTSTLVIEPVPSDDNTVGQSLEVVELPLLGTSLLEDCDVSLSSHPVARAASGTGSASSSSAVGRPAATGLPASSVLVSAPEREEPELPSSPSCMTEQSADVSTASKGAAVLRAGLERRGPHQWEDREISSLGEPFATECVVATVESLREDPTWSPRASSSAAATSSGGAAAPPRPNRMPDVQPNLLTPPMASFSWWDVAADAEEPMAPPAAASGLPRGPQDARTFSGKMSLTMGALRQQEAVLEVMRLASHHASAGAELTVNDLQAFLRGTPYEEFLVWFAHHSGSATVGLDELSAALANFYLRPESEPAVEPNGDATAAAVSAALSAANTSCPPQRPPATPKGDAAVPGGSDEGGLISDPHAGAVRSVLPPMPIGPPQSKEPDAAAATAASAAAAAAAAVATVPWREAPLRREEVKDVEPTGAPSELQGLAIATPPSGGATPQAHLEPRMLAAERRAPAAAAPAVSFTVIAPQEPLDVPQISTGHSPASRGSDADATEVIVADAQKAMPASPSEQVATTAGGNSTTAMNSVLQEVDEFSNRIVAARELEEQKHRSHRARVELLERKCQELEQQLGAAKQTEVALRQELLNTQYAEEEAPMVQEVKAQERTDFRYWRSPASRNYTLAREISAHTAAHDALGLPGLPGSGSLNASSRASLGLGPSFTLSPVAEEPREDLLSMQEVSPEPSSMSMLQSQIESPEQISHVVAASGCSGELSVKVLAAHNLTNVDSGIIGDVSDPFVAIRIGSEERKTKVIYNNLNPVWDEEPAWFSVDSSVPESRTLTLEVLDHSNFHSPRTLGLMTVDIFELPEGCVKRRGKLQDGENGELEVELTLKAEAGRWPPSPAQFSSSPGPFGLSSPVQCGSSPAVSQESPISGQFGAVPETPPHHAGMSSEDASTGGVGTAAGARAILDETLALGQEQLQHLEECEEDGSQLRSDDETEMQKLVQMCARLRSAGDVLPKAEIESLNTLVSRLSQLMERRRPTVSRVRDRHPSPWQTPNSSLGQETLSRHSNTPPSASLADAASSIELQPATSVPTLSPRSAGVPALALAPLARCVPAIQPDARHQELPSPRDVPVLR